MHRVQGRCFDLCITLPRCCGTRSNMVVGMQLQGGLRLTRFHGVEVFRVHQMVRTMCVILGQPLVVVTASQQGEKASPAPPALPPPVPPRS